MNRVDPVYPPPEGSQGYANGAPPPPGIYDPPDNKQQPPPSYQPAQPYGQQAYGQPMAAPYGQSSANTVVINQPGPGQVVHQPYNHMPDNTGAIIFSCIVAWCCCLVLGLIAFVYAITSRSQGDVQLAWRKLRISRNLSIAGLVVGIAFYVISVILRIVLTVLANS